jgi:SAM-dependent methyltransferase
MEQSMTDESGEAAEEAEARAYLDQVMREIEAEVQQRRASGDLPLRVERELDELFLEFSPVAGRGGTLTEALRLLDDAAFIDPVVPVASDKSGGAVVKKGLRSMTLWYMGFVTHQVSQFASATGRALHLVSDELDRLRDELDRLRVDAPPVIESDAHQADGWWVPLAVTALGEADGRVLHAACGDGWLVRRLEAAGVDAYGVDPRPDVVERATDGGVDLRGEDVFGHLRATAPGALAGLVLTGVADGPSPGQRAQLLELVLRALGPGSPLVVHSLSRRAWEAEEVAPAIDVSPGRPWRPATWVSVLDAAGYRSTVHPGPAGDDYLVVAVHGHHAPTPGR